MDYLRRKWLKFVAISGKYEKSVKLCGPVAQRYYYDLEPREVTAEPPVFRDGKVFVNGYYRLRTDEGFCVRCGKYGIPDDKYSQLAKDFERHMYRGEKKFREKLWIKENQKRLAIERAKAEETYLTAMAVPRYTIAAQMGIPTALVSDELLAVRRNQIAISRVIKRIRRLTNENKTDENK